MPVGPITFEWDYTVWNPLWDATGLLPEEPEWFRTTLGLDDALIQDLEQWGKDMCALDGDPPRGTMDDYAAMDARARKLVARVQATVGSRFEVRYRPWVVVEADAEKG